MEPDYDHEIDVQGALASARHRILANDYPLGVHHLSLAAGVDPANADVIDLLQIVVDEVGAKAIETVECTNPDRPTAGEISVRAWFLEAAGRGDAALNALLPLVQADPRRGWSAWLARWLDDDPDLAFPAEALLATFRDLLEAAPSGAPGWPDGIVADVTVAAARAIEEGTNDGWLLSTASALARRAGRAGDAVAWAAAGETVQPTALSASMLGYAHRAAGDPQAAFLAFEAASGRAPGDIGHRLDAADSLAAQGAWHDAETWAGSAWRLDAESGPAAARTLIARYRDTGDTAYALELFGWLDARMPDGGGAQASFGDAVALADALSAELPWTGHIPLPVNNVTSLLPEAQAFADRDRRGPIPVTFAAPESPSALVALAHALRRRLAVTVRDVPEPDPREARGDVRTLSWALVDDVLVPAVHPPTARALAGMRVTPSRWYRLDAAARDGAHLAQEVSTINDVVALALHAQPGPDGVTPWDWVRRWQVVCCVALAERDAVDVLCDLADGPEDWLCDAALAGLLHLARRRADQRERILEFANAHLVESYTRMRDMTVPYLGSECDLFDLLPERPDEEADAARRLKQEWLELQPRR